LIADAPNAAKNATANPLNSGRRDTAYDFLECSGRDNAELLVIAQLKFRPFDKAP